MHFKPWLILIEKTMINDQEFRDPLLALQHINDTHSNPKNLVVTYTSIDKVGVNPQSRFNTPFGIYFYPLSYVIQMKMDVPFASNQPFINVCEFTNPHKILHMTSDISNQRGINLLPLFFPKQDVDEAVKEFNNKTHDDYEIKSNYSKFWLIAWILSKKDAVQWNVVMRKCGIDGFLDNGTGTIHRYEPIQGVAFEAKALKRIHVINNKKTKDLTFNYDKMTERQIADLLHSNRNINIFDFINSIPDRYKWASIIVDNKPELTDYDVKTLLEFGGKYREQIAELIAGKKKILNSKDVFQLLSYVSDKEKMKKILGSVNLKKLDPTQLQRMNNVKSFDLPSN